MTLSWRRIVQRDPVPPPIDTLPAAGVSTVSSALLTAALSFAVILLISELLRPSRALAAYCSLQMVAVLVVVLPPVLFQTWLAVLLPVPIYLCGACLILWYRGCIQDKVDEQPPEEEVKKPEVRRSLINSRLDQTARSAEQSTTLLVVPVAKLRDALRARGASDVLSELYWPVRSPLLTAVTVGDTRTGEFEPCRRFALVSYRQEYSAVDGATMDAGTLASVVDVAEAAGIGALWCDAWCYKTAWAPYDHQHFCNTLAAVTLHASEVVWLPRARPNAPPSCGGPPAEPHMPSHRPHTPPAI